MGQPLVAPIVKIDPTPAFEGQGVPVAVWTKDEQCHYENLERWIHHSFMMERLRMLIRF